MLENYIEIVEKTNRVKNHPERKSLFYIEPIFQQIQALYFSKDGPRGSWPVDQKIKEMELLIMEHGISEMQ